MYTLVISYVVSMMYSIYIYHTPVMCSTYGNMTLANRYQTAVPTPSLSRLCRQGTENQEELLRKLEINTISRTRE